MGVSSYFFNSKLKPERQLHVADAIDAVHFPYADYPFDATGLATYHRALRQTRAAQVRDCKYTNKSVGPTDVFADGGMADSVARQVGDYCQDRHHHLTESRKNICKTQKYEMKSPLHKLQCPPMCCRFCQNTATCFTLVAGKSPEADILKP